MHQGKNPKTTKTSFIYKAHWKHKDASKNTRAKSQLQTKELKENRVENVEGKPQDRLSKERGDAGEYIYWGCDTRVWL